MGYRHTEASGQGIEPLNPESLNLETPAYTHQSHRDCQEYQRSGANSRKHKKFRDPNIIGQMQ